MPPPVRPVELVVADDAGIRRDIDSDDVKRAFPGLPSVDAQARLRYQAARDVAAYETIRHVFPRFVPPCMRGGEGGRRAPEKMSRVV